MNLDDKARKLTTHLQTVLDRAQALDKESAAAARELSPQEVRVLRTIGREECCIMTRLADCICLSLSSVTGLIDRLVDKKLVKRDRSSEDRRLVQVELTEQGRKAHEAAMEGRVGFARELLKGLSAEEQEALVALFAKISRRIEAEADAG